MALTTQQKTANRTARLKNAADQNDGLTVHFLQNHPESGSAGDVVVVSKQTALRLVSEGYCELAE